MKETIYTIPLMDAFNANDECPFCFIERKLEQEAISFIMGPAYMEDDIREETDRLGFCRHHHRDLGHPQRGAQRVRPDPGQAERFGGGQPMERTRCRRQQPGDRSAGGDVAALFNAGCLLLAGGILLWGVFTAGRWLFRTCRALRLLGAVRRLGQFAAGC